MPSYHTTFSDKSLTLADSKLVSSGIIFKLLRKYSDHKDVISSLHGLFFRLYFQAIITQAIRPYLVVIKIPIKL